MHLPSVLTFVCFVLTWTLIATFLWTIRVVTRDGIKSVKRMHQIPCCDCQFFTGDYRLKCTLHPSLALTEEVINCLDFCPRNK